MKLFIDKYFYLSSFLVNYKLELSDLFMRIAKCWSIFFILPLSIILRDRRLYLGVFIDIKVLILSWISFFIHFLPLFFHHTSLPIRLIFPIHSSAILFSCLILAILPLKWYFQGYRWVLSYLSHESINILSTFLIDESVPVLIIIRNAFS